MPLYNQQTLWRTWGAIGLASNKVLEMTTMSALSCDGRANFTGPQVIGRRRKILMHAPGLRQPRQKEAQNSLAGHGWTFLFSEVRNPSVRNT